MNKIQLEEYGESVLFNEISKNISISNGEIKRLFQIANNKIKKALRLKRDPLIFEHDKVSAQSVAGTIKLSNRIELEIYPKFLKQRAKTIAWKEDFYLLSAMSKYGKLLSSEGIKSSTAMRSSLYELAARTLAEQYLMNHRFPIRKYRKDEFSDYSIEGDVVFERNFEVNLEGIPQEKINFDGRNIYNATILQAMNSVRKYVSDLKTLRVLEIAIARLSPQESIHTLGRRLLLPNRNRNWNDIYNLSYDILLGMGSVFDSGKILSPGFVASTWQIWEWLVSSAVKIGNKNMKVVLQDPIYFGDITIKGEIKEKTKINVHPDVAVYESKSGRPKYLLDAKYKYLGPKDSISRADLYEAYAFCKAAKSDMIFMVYPLNSDSECIDGSINVIQESMVDGKRIIVAKVSMTNIIDEGGIVSFSNNLVNSINSYLA